MEIGDPIRLDDALLHEVNWAFEMLRSRTPRRSR